ncbi:hypothetical protein Tco_1314139 [Tanacetum coccineum]
MSFWKRIKKREKEKVMMLTWRPSYQAELGIQAVLATQGISLHQQIPFYLHSAVLEDTQTQDAKIGVYSIFTLDENEAADIMYSSQGKANENEQETTLTGGTNEGLQSIDLSTPKPYLLPYQETFIYKFHHQQPALKAEHFQFLKWSRSKAPVQISSGPPFLITPGITSVQDSCKSHFTNTICSTSRKTMRSFGSPSSTTIDQDEQSTSTSPTNQEIQSQVTHQGPVPQFMAPDHSSSGPVLHEMTSDQIRSDLTPNRQETSVDNISSDLVSNKQKASDYDISGPSHEYQWTKDHPIEQVIDNPTNPVQTRQQLATDLEMCMFALTVSTEEPKNINGGNVYILHRIEAMQDDLHKFSTDHKSGNIATNHFGKTSDKLKWLRRIKKKDEVQTVIRNKAMLVG